jgi:diguanylate cyclase (GGDEF)-like protein
MATMVAIRSQGPAVARFGWSAWPLVTLLFAAAEVWVVHLEFRRAAHTISLSEIPLVLGLIFLAPPYLVAAQLLGAGPILLFHRRQGPLKLVFNLAQLALSVELAALVYHVGRPGADPLGPTGWLLATVATTVAALVGVIAVSGVISLSEGRLSLAKRLPVMVFSLAGAVVNACLALVVAVVVSRDPRAGALLLMPAAALYLAYRAYTRERQKTERIEFLYNSGRTLAATGAAQSSIVALLREALQMFRAELAQVTVMAGGSGQFEARTTVRGDEVVEVEHPVDPGGEASFLERVMAADHGAIIGSDSAAEAERALLTGRDIRDAMITSLKSDNRVIGTILVGNRLGAVSSFTGDDLALLETLATQVGAAVENARLERVLHHQAFHDSLTNLGNRGLFTQRLDHALNKSDPRVAVLSVDIDDFKTVNDTLGHSAGDQLLVKVAEQLALAVRGGDTAARRGGDEFAVLVEDITDVGDAVVAARRVLEVFRRPYSVAGRELRIKASVGIATNLEFPTDGPSLLMQADVAMYYAKRATSGEGYCVFELSMQEEVAERHALREDLRLALERGELTNVYQPIVSLQTGRVLGTEALVRWNHPERGLVSPAYFITVAEESGLIVDLGRWVLGSACRQLREWHREFPEAAPLMVSVNLSALQLRQPGFVDDVVRVLQEVDLDARHLTLEITESTFMEDTRTAIARLRELRGLGIRVELDDFGTGYSSLSILRDLPLDGLKIDKSFVDGIRDLADRPVFLQAIVRLAQALDLNMVAEGIEHQVQADALTAIGCQRGQGYLFLHPEPAERMTEFLRQESRRVADESPTVVSLPARRRSDRSS